MCYYWTGDSPDREERLMALDNGEAGGDFVDREYWMRLAKEGALVAFRIHRIEEPTNLNRKMKDAEPVVADFVVLNGSEEGTVYRSERVIASGIVNTLRTKTVERGGKKVKVPREPGDDVAVRLAIYESFGREHPGANPCGPDEFEKVVEIFEKTDGDPYGWYERRALAAMADDDADPAGAPETISRKQLPAADDEDLPF
jgi:hypothetical protein